MAITLLSTQSSAETALSAAGGDMATSKTVDFDVIQLPPPGKKRYSILRRAFSFGSTAEFKETPAFDDDDNSQPLEFRRALSIDRDREADQIWIIEQQEAPPVLNHDIYIRERFSRSADDLSVSSTSSSSIVMHKMGRGILKSTRSFVDLFRPKLAAKVPDDQIFIPEQSDPVLLAVAVEAKQLENHIKSRFESDDTSEHSEPSPADENADMEMERPFGNYGIKRTKLDSIAEEELEEVSKEVLKEELEEISEEVPKEDPKGKSEEKAKNSDDTSEKHSEKVEGVPDTSPKEVVEAPVFGLSIDRSNTLSKSETLDDTRPSFGEDTQDHQDTILLATPDKPFLALDGKVLQGTKSVPDIRRKAEKRTATFSPSPCFYTTWSSRDYDRRGDPIIFDQLDPSGMQMIKEEINSIKMEMEVHESSKIYTHFYFSCN